MRELTLSIYRRLLRLYPAAFREEYSGELERQVREELAELHGAAAIAMLWVRLLRDLAVSIPAQLTREVAQDGRQTLRQWARQPLTTGLAIAALAIGIGANTGMFSVLNTLVLRSLPFRDPGRLAVLGLLIPAQWGGAQFQDWAQHTSYLEGAMAFDQGDTNLEGHGQGLHVRLTETTSNFFSLLGTQPLQGRAFLPEESVPGKDAVAVISYGLWQQLFAGNANALGAKIRINSAPLTIVGVAPPGFDFPAQTAIWLPSKFDPHLMSHSAFIGMMFARLKDGIPWTAAEAALRQDARRIDPRNTGARLTPLNDMLLGPRKNASLMLMAAVGLILLIACTNVANLLLARTAGREHELSIRSALGASRARLTRQLLTESLMLSVTASFLGLLVAAATAAIATKVQPAPVAAQSYSILDTRVLLFAVGISVLCGLLFGALPALHARRVHTFAARGATTRPASRAIREALVAAQIMLTVVLLSGSLTLGRGFLRLLHLDRGFDRRNMITASVSIAGTAESADTASLPYFQEVVRRVRTLPGVRDASLAEFFPLKATAFLGGPYTVDGQRSKENAMIVPVLPDYFRTIGGRILYGRDFTEQEIRSDAPVSVVNERLAREFMDPAAIVGRELRAGRRAVTIIGVVKDLVYIGDANVTEIYTPDHNPGRFFANIVARVDGRPEERMATFRDAIRSVDPQVAVYDVKTMDELLDDALLQPKVYSAAVLFFAGFGLLLAVIGIYGVVSFTVSQRTHEMGVRLALGTTPQRLRRAMLRSGLATVIAGAALGIAAAILAAKFIQSMIDGATPAGADIYVAAFLFIAATAAAANWIATRRVSRLDVMEVLRAD